MVWGDAQLDLNRPQISSFLLWCFFFPEQCSGSAAGRPGLPLLMLQAAEAALLAWRWQQGAFLHILKVNSVSLQISALLILFVEPSQRQRG